MSTDQPPPVASPVKSVVPPSSGEVITSLATGTTYTMGERIGEGSFGLVFACTDGWRNDLAVKVMKPVRSYEEVQVATMAEVERLLLLRHPHITYVYDAFEYRDTFYIVTERCYCPLTQLFTLNRFNGSVWIMPIARCLLQAVQYLHVNEYAHQDIHLNNVFAAFARDEMSSENPGAIHFKLGRVNQDLPLTGLNWFFDHAETISEQSIDRIAALGGGIAVQHRMAYQGEYFVERYGPGAAEATPPVASMLEKGIKVSAGTDATRVASYNPWVSLAWLVTGRTVGGLRIYPQHNCLERETALRMWTENVTWFSNEEGKKGHIQVGQLADLIVPDRDYLACAESEIADTTSDLTIVGGRIVYGAGDFAQLDDKGPPPAMPDWSPVRAFGGYAAWADPSAAANQAVQQRAAASCGCAHACSVHGHGHATAWSSKLPTADLKSFWGALGCSCWAV